MRITVRTTPSGDQFMSRFPEWAVGIDEVTSNGHLDSAKMLAALAPLVEHNYVTLGGGDDRRVLAFVFEFLHQLKVVTEHVDEDENSDAHVDIKTAADERMEKRMDRGKFAFTRFDITSGDYGVKVRVSCANPREVPGRAFDSARRFGVFACRILRYIQGQIEAKSGVRVILEGVGECADIFDEADWTDRKMDHIDGIREANARREACENLHHGYCSPACPTCGCYRDGRCEPMDTAEVYRKFK